MFVLNGSLGKLMLIGLAGLTAPGDGPASRQAQGPPETEALTYDPLKRIVISGQLSPSVCVGFGCAQPCNFIFLCPFYPPTPFNHLFPLSTCGASVAQPLPDVALADEVASNGASASASVTASGAVTAYAGGRSLGARIVTEALFTASAIDNACNALPPPPGADASLSQAITVEIPFTTSGGEYALQVLLFLQACDDENASGSFSITGLGPWAPVIAEGPLDTAGFATQGTIAPGNYVFRATLASTASLCACAPCGESDVKPPCSHSPEIVVGLGVTACLGDTDGNGTVATPDLLALLQSWGPCPPLVPGTCPAACAGDLNGDRVVNNQDLLLLLANWGPCLG